jgi:TolB-like protein
VIPDGDVRQQLDRILKSPGFAGSARLKRFLTYVVEQHLTGEGAKLKEYAIGVEVFDRKEPYDPRLDSIVRVEAGRLRSKIDEYYSGEGAADEIRISLPRGSYVPVFERRSPGVPAPSSQADGATLHDKPWSRRSMTIVLAGAAVIVVAVLAGWRSLAGTSAVGITAPGISIAVLPFDQFSGSEADVRLADQITDEVTTALARVGKLSVVSRTSARQFQGVRKPMHEIGDALGAQIVMEAAVEVEGDGVLVQPRLVDATIDRKIWVGSFRGPRNGLRDLAARIAAEATDAVLKREEERRRKNEERR